MAISLIIDDRIRERRVRFFNEFTFDLKYDSVASAFSFSFLYDPDNPEHRELAVSGHYHIAKILDDDDLILTGYILSHSFSDSQEKQLASFSGYSLPGFLQDCTIPKSAYPLQYDGLTLRQISQKIIRNFEIIRVSVSSLVGNDMDKVIGTTEAQTTSRVKQYLAGLATDLNIVMGHDERGNILFTRANTDGSPIFNVDRDNDPVPFITEWNLTFDGQGMHSEITALKQADDEGGQAGEFTIKNPYVPFVFRPTTINQSSGDDNDTEKTARAALSNELKNLTVTLKTDRWRINGELIKPNNTCVLRNKHITLFNHTKLFIESVNLSGNESNQTATLRCVIPEVYNNRFPKYIWEGINVH